MAVEIISIILKSVLSGKSINELIGGIKDAVIDEISETSMKHIEDLVDKSRDKLKNVLSEKNLVALNISNTDYVKAELKDILTHVKIDNELLERCQYNVEELKEFLWENYELGHVNIEMERDIQKGIDAVSNVLIDLFYKSEEFAITLMIAINKNVNSANRTLNNTNQMLQKISDKEDEIYKAIITSNDVQSEQRNTEQKPYNKAAEYVAVWDGNMFLNNFDERDENAGPNVKLSDVYKEEHLPHYIWRDNKKPSTELKKLLSEYIIDKTDNKMLLVLGQLGIGKSTLITWILANYKNQKDEIMVYRFSSDLKGINWQKTDVYTDILEKLDLSYDRLNKKILILDGFDEISAVKNRKNILNSLYWNLVKSNAIKGFSLIITCRENYIEEYKSIQCAYITLQPWNESQISSFCKAFGKITETVIDEKTIENINKKADVLGIPLILYMVLSLNIKLESTYSMVDIYDKIFSLEGGIYDRCINHKEYAESHRIEKIKEYIHNISKKIAIWIFENNPDEEIISQKAYETICDAMVSVREQQDISIKQDVLICNFFERIKECEGKDEEIGTDGLRFIHRSIYEYFVADTIYCSIKDAWASALNNEQEVLVEDIVNYLKTGQLNKTIGEFLRYKILLLCNNMADDEKLNFLEWLEITVGKMLEKGMLCYIEKDMKKFDYIIKHEAICFRNIMYLLSLVSEACTLKELLFDIKSELLQSYIHLFCIANQFEEISHKNHLSDLIIKNIDLSECNLSHIKLDNIDFSGSNLEGIDMEGVILYGAVLSNAVMTDAYLVNANLTLATLQNVNLENANLRNTYLTAANLEDANFRNADLNEANLMFANFKNANLEDANLEGSIWSKETILKVLPQLQKATFKYIKIEMDNSDKIIRVSRKDLFSTELF